MASEEEEDIYGDSLPSTIDVGGDIYDLGTSANANLAYKGRDRFKETFNSKIYGDIKRNEYLLRKYLFIDQRPQDISFTTIDEKRELINIIKKRIEQLKTSEEYGSNLIKNISIRRYRMNLLEILQKLDGDTKVKTKVPIKKLNDNEIFQMILQMGWYLAHPEQVPGEIENEWAKIVEDLSVRSTRLGDIVEKIKRAETEKGLLPEESSYNYFKRIDMGKVVKKDTIQGALDEAKEMALDRESEQEKKTVVERFKTLIQVLQLKGYLDESLPKSKNGVNMINESELKAKLPVNPMSGGNQSILSLPLGQAMLPLFDYFKVMYDPIYSFLQNASQSPKKKLFPQLITMLHICNTFYLNTDKNVSKNKYGVYHIKNIPGELRTFFKDQLKATTLYLSELTQKEQKDTFKQQLFKLPKVRLSSLITNTGDPARSSSQNSIPYIQFLLAGTNLTVPDLATFKKKTNQRFDSKIQEQLTKLFTDDELFLIYTDSLNSFEYIPMKLFEIDYNTVSITENIIPILEDYSKEFKDITEMEKETLYLDQLCDIDPYVTYNDAELALSIFIALKERMPK